MMHRLTFDFVLWGSRSNVGSWNGEWGMEWQQEKGWEPLP